MLPKKRTFLYLAVSLLFIGLGIGGYSYKNAHSDSHYSLETAESGVGAQFEKSLRRVREHARKAAPNHQLHNFHIMESPREAIPQALRTRIRDTLGNAGTRLSMKEGQYIQTRAGGIWLVNSGEVTCIIQASKGAVSCNETAFVAAHGLALAVFTAPERPKELLRHFLLLGVAPDWARTVIFRVERKKIVRVIHKNSYALRAEKPIFLEAICAQRWGACWNPSVDIE